MPRDTTWTHNAFHMPAFLLASAPAVDDAAAVSGNGEYQLSVTVGTGRADPIEARAGVQVMDITIPATLPDHIRTELETRRSQYRSATQRNDDFSNINGVICYAGGNGKEFVRCAEGLLTLANAHPAFTADQGGLIRAHSSSEDFCKFVIDLTRYVNWGGCLDLGVDECDSNRSRGEKGR